MSESQFVENLKKIRAERELSQKQLGDAIDMNQSAISDYERGIKFPSYQSLEKIAEVLQVDVGDLTHDVNFNFKGCDGNCITLDDKKENTLKYILSEMEKQTELLGKILNKI
jgi:transcriptional regulator with XRE-family HTH domain